MKEIQLSKRGKHRGKYVALVDDEDFDRVNKFNWCASKHRNTFYAQRKIIINGKHEPQYLHWLIMGEKWIDHCDHEGLNCQKYNLRSCTHQQNIMNTMPNKNTSSTYKGVCWHKRGKKWASQIRFNYKQIHLGLYSDEVDAAKSYNEKAIELFGEFACLNII